MPGTGKISQVIGSTFDVEFPEDQLPRIYNAVKIDEQGNGQSIRLTGEVASHLGGGKIRAVALGSTDGLRRGMACVDTGGPLSVPVGKETLGRVFNLLGDPIDNRGPVNAEGGGEIQRRPIHREPPAFEDLTPKAEVFETGIKVIDLLTPFLAAARPASSAARASAKPSSSRSSSPVSPSSTAATPSSPASVNAPAKAPTCGWKCRKPRSATPASTSSTRPSWCSAR